VPITIPKNPQPRNIILSVDKMFFTGMIFLITVSRNVSSVTATLLADRKKQTILIVIQHVLKIYQGRGHVIDDMEFLELENPVHMILADKKFSH
jgi:hypothetical protein